MKIRKKRYSSVKSPRFRARKLIILAVVAALVIVGVILVRHNNSPPAIKDQGNKASQAQNQATAATPGSQSGATDTAGQASGSTNPNNWAKSDSGVITLKTPTANTKLASGFNLSGAAEVGQVQYRLLDYKVGVISQSSLNVIGGNFSGNVSFKTSDTKGRLDVFSYDSGGAEINEIQIPVTF